MAGFFGRTHELEVVRATLARAPGEQRPTAVVVDGEVSTSAGSATRKHGGHRS